MVKGRIVKQLIFVTNVEINKKKSKKKNFSLPLIK